MKLKNLLKNRIKQHTTASISHSRVAVIKTKNCKFEDTRNQYKSELGTATCHTCKPLWLILMRHIIYIWILVILVSCSRNSNKKTDKIETKIKTETIIENDILSIDTIQILDYSIELKDWIEYYKEYSIQLADFVFVRQNNLPDIFTSVDTFDLSKDIYKPYYKYSPDSNIVLDLISYNLPLELNEKNELISYGGDVDSEVSIKDLKNKMWKRVLFVGSFYKIEDGFWINNDRFLITGQFNDNDQNKYKSSIWFVDLKKGIIQTFESRDYVENMNCNYLNKVRYKGIKMAE